MSDFCTTVVRFTQVAREESVPAFANEADKLTNSSQSDHAMLACTVRLTDSAISYSAQSNKQASA